MAAPETVLVTGASTGIGKAIVEDLREKGVRVFAAVRDLSTVDEHPLVTSLRLDVTSSAEIAEAVESVAASLGESKLRGIVNNAGVSLAGPMEVLDLDEIRRHFDVNVFAQIEVTQEFMPILREQGPADPRVVFMGSIASRAAPPFLGPYAAGKHALRAVSESMRGELRDSGIKVSIVEPGNIATPIWDKAQDNTQALKDSLTDRGRALYGDKVELMAGVINHSNSHSIPPSKVADKVHHALFSKRPKAEYLVGFDAQQVAFAKKFVPAPVLEAIIDREAKRRGTW